MSRIRKVAFTSAPTAGYEYPEIMDYIRSLGFEAVFRPDLTLDPKDVVPRLKDVDAVLAGGDWFTAENLEQLPNIKMIARFGVGYDKVDLKKATEMGIPVTNTPGMLGHVAELVLGMILALNRGIVICDRAVRNGVWFPDFYGRDLEGKKVGLIGFGAIAQKVARLLAGFDCEILAYDLYFNDKAAEQLNVKQADLETIITECDVVSLHVPLTDVTRGMVNAEFLKKMKKSAILINTARGAVVDENALYHALKNKEIRGAATDVYAHEPASKDNPLFTLDNIIATPHVAAMTLEGNFRMGKAAADELAAFNEGRPLRFLVNKDCKFE